DQAELIRLFYVATTRAADHLILSGGLFDGDFESPKSPWLRLLSERFNLQSGDFCASLPADAVYHQPAVKASVQDPPTDSCNQSRHTRLDLNATLTNAVELAEKIAASSPCEQNDSTFDDRWVAPISADRAEQHRFSVSRLSGQLQSISEQSVVIASGEEGI